MNDDTRELVRRLREPFRHSSIELMAQAADTIERLQANIEDHVRVHVESNVTIVRQAERVAELERQLKDATKYAVSLHQSLTEAHAMVAGLSNDRGRLQAEVERLRGALEAAPDYSTAGFDEAYDVWYDGARAEALQDAE